MKTLFISFRCYVGDISDQWRTCSEQYFPPPKRRPSSTPPSVIIETTVSQHPFSSTTIQTDSFHQAPPKPGGLLRVDDLRTARLWPVTYIYSAGPPNITQEISFNVVDCIKERC